LINIYELFAPIVFTFAAIQFLIHPGKNLFGRYNVYLARVGTIIKPAIRRDVHRYFLLFGWNIFRDGKILNYFVVTWPYSPYFAA
jgi:hypothetical protein